MKKLMKSQSIGQNQIWMWKYVQNQTNYDKTWGNLTFGTEKKYEGCREKLNDMERLKVNVQMKHMKDPFWC